MGNLEYKQQVKVGCAKLSSFKIKQRVIVFKSKLLELENILNLFYLFFLLVNSTCKLSILVS